MMKIGTTLKLLNGRLYKMEFTGNLGVELCEDILTLPRARSTSGRSVIIFGGDDYNANNLKSCFIVFDILVL